MSPPPDPNTILLLESIRDGLRRMEGSMITALQANNDVANDQLRQAHVLEESMAKRMSSESRGGPNQHFGKGLTMLGFSVMSLGSIMKDTMGQANDLQKEALSRGHNLASRIREQTVVTQGLTANILGYSDALAIGFDAFSKGLRTNNVALAKMGALSKLTTGQQKQLFKAVAQNTEGLGFNDEAMTRLSMSTISLSQKFGVTVEELQDSLKVLGQELKVMGALGLGPQFVEAATRLSAALGPELASLGPTLLNSLTKGSSMIQASILGVAKERQDVISGEGDMTRKSFALMMKASDKAIALTKQWTRNSSDATFMMSQMEGVYGGHMKELVQWRSKMDAAAKASGMSTDKYIESVIRQEKVNEEYKKTFAAFKSRVLSPFQKLFSWFYKVMVKLMDIPGIDILASVIVGLTGILIGLATIQTLVRSSIGRNTTALIANTRASLAQATQSTGSALSNLLYFMPWGRKGKMKLPGSHRNVKSGRFAKGPTGFFDKIKSFFGVGKTVAAKPGAVAKGGLALTRAGGGSALKGLGAVLKGVLGKLLFPLTILFAIFAELDRIKKTFSKFGARMKAMFAPVMVQLQGLWVETKKMFSGIDNLFSPIGKALAVVIDIVMDLLAVQMFFVAKIFQVIVWAVKMLVKGINWVFKEVINPVVAILNDILNAIGDIWSSLTDWFDFSLDWPDWFSDDTGGGSAISADMDKYAVALEPYYDSTGKIGSGQLDELIGLNAEQKNMTELLQQQNELLEEIVAAGYNPGGVPEPTTPVTTRPRPRGPRGS